jgi:AraC-like DNA-binding protein
MRAVSSHIPPGMISARMVLRVIAYCRARGHDPEELCRSAGLSLKLLSEPEARVHYSVAAQLGERALAVTGDRDFGLHLARDVGDSQHYDAGVLLLMASATPRVALTRMVERQRYWGDGQRATLHAVLGGAALRYVLPGAEGEYARHADECALAEIALGLRALSGQPLVPRLARFRHALPARTDEHRAVFQCALEFRAPHTEIVFDDAVLDARMLHANQAFCAIFEQQVERALARLPNADSASEHVRAAARAALGSGACTLEGTARAMSVSVRTLQRRLQQEGTSFVDVVDALRRELAIAYLERSLPIPEIATLLGYADDTAFHHAFNRWTGSSPSRYLLPARDS